MTLHQMLRVTPMPLQAPAVIVAASAGVHPAPVPEHLRESAAPGAAFMLAVAALMSADAALVWRPEDRAATKLVEALGLACAIWHSQQPGGRRSPSIQEEPR